MNIREKAITELTKKIIESAGNAQEEFVGGVLKRMSDPNLFALYVEVFGRVIGEPSK